MDDRAHRSAPNAFLRSLFYVVASLVVGAGGCAVLLRVDSSPADTGPVLTLGLWCAFIELGALGIGTFLAARRSAHGAFQTVVAAGVVGYVLLGLVLVVLSGRDGAEVTLYVLPVAIGVCAAGAAVGRR